eukprot:scaffold13166_cov114-Isochrysis_galbana.AAC.2
MPNAKYYSHEAMHRHTPARPCYCVTYGYLWRVEETQVAASRPARRPTFSFRPMAAVRPF